LKRKETENRGRNESVDRAENKATNYSYGTIGDATALEDNATVNGTERWSTDWVQRFVMSTTTETHGFYLGI